MKKLLLAALALFSVVAQAGSHSFDGIEGFVLNEGGRDNSDVVFLNDDGSVWYSFPANAMDDGTDLYDEAFFWPYVFDVGEIALSSMRCVARTDKGYRVVVNENTGLVKTLKPHGRLIFETIEEYAVHKFIDADFVENPVRTAPREDAPIVIDVYGMMEKTGWEVPVYSIARQGDWLQVDVDDFEHKTTVRGWVRWREEGEYVVDFFEGW